MVYRFVGNLVWTLEVGVQVFADVDVTVVANLIYEVRRMTHVRTLSVY